MCPRLDPCNTVTVMGSDVSVGADGDQGYNGSYYVFLADMDGTFNKIVQSSGVVSFEAADFLIDPPVSDIPQPASVTLLGTGLLGILIAIARRGNRQIHARAARLKLD